MPFGGSVLLSSGAAPPPSKKFMPDTATPPRLEVLPDVPIKYGARLTAVPLTVPGARIPGTAFMGAGSVV